MDSSSVGFKIPTEGYQDSRHQLQALLAEQGLDSCLMQGHIYKGTEWRLAERGVFDDDWGWKARHAAADAWARKWAGVSPIKLCHWSEARQLLAAGGVK